MSNPTIKMWGKRLSSLKSTAINAMSRPHRNAKHFDRYANRLEMAPWLKVLKFIFFNIPVTLLFWPFLVMRSMVGDCGGSSRLDVGDWLFVMMLGLINSLVQLMLLVLLFCAFVSNVSPSTDQLNREMAASTCMHDTITASLQTRDTAISYRDLASFRADCTPVVPSPKVLPSSLTEQKKALLK